MVKSPAVDVFLTLLDVGVFQVSKASHSSVMCAAADVSQSLISRPHLVEQDFKKIPEIIMTMILLSYIFIYYHMNHI